MKQTNFHSAKLKIKRTALLVVGLTLFQILAWAGPRSFQQAQSIAERQAALQGIVMDQQQVSKREYLGLINVYTSKTSTKPTFKEGSSSAEEYMCVPVGESTTRTITLNQTANEMYVWVTDRDGEILLDGVKFKVGQIGAGESTGISQVTAQNNISISTAAGVLTIVSAESKLISVYSISGQFITKLSVSANIPAQVNLRPGIYIVDGRKVTVK